MDRTTLINIIVDSIARGQVPEAEIARINTAIRINFERKRQNAVLTVVVGQKYMVNSRKRANFKLTVTKVNRVNVDGLDEAGRPWRVAACLLSPIT
jgi:hypothetical protein